MPSGVNLRISFEEVRNGSQYKTSDPDLQYAIEHDANFNKGFILAETKEEDEKKSAEPVAQEEVKTETTIKVNSISEARDFLAENFDYTRSNLRSKTAIISAGKEHNIIFEGI